MEPYNSGFKPTSSLLRTPNKDQRQPTSNQSMSRLLNPMSWSSFRNQRANQINTTRYQNDDMEETRGDMENGYDKEEVRGEASSTADTDEFYREADPNLPNPVNPSQIP